MIHDSSVVLPVEQWIEIGTVPAIIDKEEFQKVAEKLIQNRVQAKRNNKTKQYLLRAMVSCGWCNMASIARCLSSGHSYYVCTGKIKAKFLQPEQLCPARFAPAEQLDELVWQDLCSLILNPTQIRQALERAYSGSWLPQALQARQQNLRKAQNSLTSQIERLTDAYLAATIPLAEYQKRRSDLENKKLILERQVEELSYQVDRQKEIATIFLTIEDFCQRIETGLKKASFEQKRQLVELLVDRVIVKDDQVEIHYVIPTSKKNEDIRFCHLRSDYRYNIHK